MNKIVILKLIVKHITDDPKLGYSSILMSDIDSGDPYTYLEFGAKMQNYINILDCDESHEWDDISHLYINDCKCECDDFGLMSIISTEEEQVKALKLFEKWFPRLSDADREAMIRFLVEADMSSVYDDPQIAADWVEDGRVGYRSYSTDELINAYKIHHEDYKSGDKIITWPELRDKDIRSIEIDVDKLPDSLKHLANKED